MQHKFARKVIMQLLGDAVRFEGHFDECFDSLKESQQEQLMRWVKGCGEKKENPIQSMRDKSIIGFVKRIGSNVRAVLVKEKGGFFIVVFLDKHKYYEEEMTKWGF